MLDVRSKNVSIFPVYLSVMRAAPQKNMSVVFLLRLASQGNSFGNAEIPDRMRDLGLEEFLTSFHVRLFKIFLLGWICR